MRKIIIRFSIAFVVISLFTFMFVSVFVDFSSCKKSYYNIEYAATEGGKIEGKVNQVVAKGKNAETVIAIPDDGYRFLKWSDTCSPEPTRTDKNITSDISIKAQFIKISEIKYKVLLIYVPEVQATLTAGNSEKVTIDYKMTDLDILFCHTITKQFDIFLNELFEGLVTVEIDEYFTKEIMREQNIEQNVDVCTHIFAEKIPEVADKLKNYDSYIVTFGMNDPDFLVNRGYEIGVAHEKSASIHYEKILRTSISEDTTIEDGINQLISKFDLFQWRNSIISTYIHEFTHTVEMGITIPAEESYHMVLELYNSSGRWSDEIAITKLYLLNRAECNGKTVGIPFEVWKGEVYTVIYDINDDDMGYINGRNSAYFPFLRIAKGYDVWTVTASPLDGYEFVEWSDGVTSISRTDCNIQSDLTVTAIFKPIIYEINYIAGEGGKIDGELIQQNKIYTPFNTVIAIADEGYEFVGWSDGYKSARRIDFLDCFGIEKFDESNSITVYAIFKKSNE